MLVSREEEVESELEWGQYHANQLAGDKVVSSFCKPSFFVVITGRVLSE